MTQRQNPLLSPVPQHNMERVKALALDIAYGVAEGVWYQAFACIGPNIMFFPVKRVTGEEHPQFQEMSTIFRNKWYDKHPQYQLLDTLGYAQIEPDSSNRLMLTAKGLNLYNNINKVFISYKRGESSPFALFIESQIRAEDTYLPFLDRSLEVGGIWHGELEQQISEAQYLILLVSKETSESAWVLQEVEWAHQHKTEIIPICHHGVDIENCGISGIKGINGILVAGNSAEHYENAVDKLLNKLKG